MLSYSRKSWDLSALCEVQTGYTARRRLEPVTKGGARAIQLGDLHGNEEIDPARCRLYLLEGSLDRYQAKPGDLLFRSRGERNTAVVISPTSTMAAVAVLPLMVLRPNRDLVDPRYLAWFINHPGTQRYFDECARGTSLRMIPKTDLDNLEVELPNLATQKLIVEIDILARREHALAHQLADRKLQLTSFALLQQVRKAQPHGNGAGRLTARQTSKPGGHIGTDKLRR
jgi:hypothetical protein